MALGRVARNAREHGFFLAGSSAPRPIYQPIRVSLVPK